MIQEKKSSINEEALLDELKKLRVRDLHLRTAARAGRLAIWEHHIGDGIFKWSEGADELLGLQSPGAVQTFEDFLMIVHDEDRKRVESEIQKSIANGQDHEIEFRIVRDDGSIYWIIKRGKVIKNSEGVPVLVIGIGLDITDRKGFESRLLKAAEQLWRVNQELEQFAYISSHDLQEPLRKIAVYSQMLSQKIPDTNQEVSKYVEMISSSAFRMRKLIDDILNYSQISKDDDRTWVSIDLNSTLKRIISDLDLAIQDKKAVITMDDLPTVIAHPTKMYQLFQNLLRNAIKFHGEAPLQIHVGAQLKGNIWTFSVRDNGIGINPQFKDQIFQVFSRLHGRHKYPGNGIGLALCKKIVEQHEGKIWVESTEGAGATFFFTLPADGKTPEKTK